MLTRTILALSVGALTLAGVAGAQERATLTLRSGDVLRGQLIDLGGVGFTMEVNGIERQVPTSDVAVIDFIGGSMTDADWAHVSDGIQTVVLRSGEMVTGQLYDIGGTAPLKITFRTPSGDHEFSAAEVSRIILARPAVPVATSGTLAQLAPPTDSEPGVSVSRRRWTPTGLMVRKGEVLTLNTTSEVRSGGDGLEVAGSAGSRSGRRAAHAQMPGVPAGALLGRIGTDGQPFAIGSQSTLTAPAAGQLFLGVNDAGVDASQGDLHVRITRHGSSR